MSSEKYKVLEIINALDKHALKKARLYLCSPLHCTNDSLLLLFDHLLKVKGKGFDKETAYRAVRSKGTYTDKAIHRLMYLLTKELEDFLAWQVYQSKPHDRDFFLLEAWQDLELDKFFFRDADGIQQKLEKMGKASFYERFNLARLLFFHPTTDKYDLKHRHYQEMMQFLERDSLLKTLKFSGEWLLYKRVLNVRSGPPLLTSLIDIAGLENNPSFPIRLFAGILFLYEQQVGKNEDFSSLCFQLREKRPELNWEEAALAVKLLVNYAGHRAERGEVFYLEQLFEVIKWALDKDLFLENGRISEVRFTNVVAVAAKCREFDWARDFMAQYQDRIVMEEGQETMEVLALNRAYLFYHEGLDRLPETKLLENAYAVLMTAPRSSDVTKLRLYSLNARILFDLLLFSNQAFYEDQFYANLKNFRSFLKRQQKISPVKKQTYRQFLDYLLKFSRSFLQPDDQQSLIELWQQEIDGENVFMKDWLLQKLQDINSLKYRQ